MYRNTLTTITAIFSLTLNFVFTQVVINEIHYNPSTTQGSDTYYEFFELHNPGTEVADVSRYSLTQGVVLAAATFIDSSVITGAAGQDSTVYDTTTASAFPDGTTIAAGGYLVVSKDSSYYPGTIEWGSNSLSNGGEDIVLVDASGAVVDTVDYEDGCNAFGDWGTGADGGGGSLELIDASIDNNLASNWQTSWTFGGTPGAANSTEPTATVTTIYNVQHTTSADGMSTMAGEYVQVSGIVTGTDNVGNSSAFAIQDGSGPWTGIYCYWSHFSNCGEDSINVGDEVTVRGTVAEYVSFGGDTTKTFTQLSSGRIVSVNSSGNVLPDAVTLALEDVADEQYEGVRVTTSGRVVEAAVCESGAPGYNYCEWRISNNLDFSDLDADTINVNDRFAVTSPQLNTIATVTGPLNQWGGSTNSPSSWRIEPAAEEDVQIECDNAYLSITIEMIDTYGDGWNGATYTLLDNSAPPNVIAVGGLEAGASDVDEICLFEGTFNIIVGGGSYDGEIQFNILDAFGNHLVYAGVANVNPNPPYIPDPPYYFAVTGINVETGCMDGLTPAVNYDPLAGVDDGSCYYIGEVCDSPFVLAGTAGAETQGVANPWIDQYFVYTAVENGNMTVSSVGLTDEDTYLVLFNSCDIDTSYTIETSVVVGSAGQDSTVYDTTYVDYSYDMIGYNDDVNGYGTEPFQSELTICVAEGEQYIIGWIAVNYVYGDEFNFVVYETPDIITPINMSAYGTETGIEANWEPIPIGCAGDRDASGRAEARTFSPIKVDRLKPGFKSGHIVGKYPDRGYLNNQQNTETNLTRNRECEAGDENLNLSFVCPGTGNCWLSEVTWEIADLAGNLLFSGDGYTSAAEVCLEPGNYVANGVDSYGDGWNAGGALVGTSDDGTQVFSLSVTGGTGSQEFTICEGGCIYGCTDQAANNYNPDANTDDGSCVYPGASCYDPVVVTVDNGATASDAIWFQVDVPAGGDGQLYLENVVGGASWNYYYIYNSCTGSAITAGYNDLIVDFSADTWNSSGTATMDTYQGTSVYVGLYQASITNVYYEQTILGCTDPNAGNYVPTANVDDGSCECGPEAVVLTMNDAYGDGWNGNGWAITNATGEVLSSGTLSSGTTEQVEVCLPSAGVYNLWVGAAPAAVGSWASEISWLLTTPGGYPLASGDAPFEPTAENGGTFDTESFPAYTFQLYRNDELLDANIVSASYFDATAVAGTEYCYNVTQTEEGQTTSGFSNTDCSIVYVPSTCATAVAVAADSIYQMTGITGRNEWYSYEASLNGYLTVSSAIPGNDDIYEQNTRLYVYSGDCSAPVEIGYNSSVYGDYGYLSSVTVVVDSGATYHIKWDTYYNPGPTLWTVDEFPSGHQPPRDFSAVGDHEKIHLSWGYPLDAYSNAIRSAYYNGNTVDENRDQIAMYPDETEYLLENRHMIYQGYLDANDGQPSSRDLTGTTVTVVGSVLNDDATADIIVGVDMQSPNAAYLSGVQFTFPDGIVVNSAVQTEGSTGTYSYCGVYIEGSVVTIGDSAGVNDPDINPDGDWGCIWYGYHSFTINVDVYPAPIEMGYLISDDCYPDFDNSEGNCADLIGTASVPVPTDEPLCYNDSFEPNDFFESPDTWTQIPYYGWSNNELVICPGDIDIYTADVDYGGWIHLEAIDNDASGEMEVYMWDLSISDYAIGYYTSYYDGDTIMFDYQNYGGIDGSTGTAEIVFAVNGATGASQFEYSGSVEIDAPEVYMYDVFSSGTETIVEDSIYGYNYTHMGLTNDTEYSYYAVTINEDGLRSDTSAHATASPREDMLFAPTNLVGEPWLESVNLHWDAPPTLTPGNLFQSAFEIDMLPFVGSGNTANGFENNYDDCSDISDSPDAVYVYQATADTLIDISTCYSSFDTKVYVYEETDGLINPAPISCNEDAGFYDYYYCGYYTSYVDSVQMTMGRKYYIVVDGWGGDAGYYNLQVFAHGDTSYTEGWDYDMVVTDPNHDPEQKALAVEEHLASIEYDNNDNSRSFITYNVLKENGGLYTVLTTTTETMYTDGSLASDQEQTYKYKVSANYDGGTSEATEAVEVVPFPQINIPQPGNFTASSNGWVVNLTWDTPPLGGGDLAYSENFDDGTLGTMTSEDLSEAGGPVWLAGTTEDATSTYWSPPDHGSFAFFNDDFHAYEFPYTNTRLTSGAINLSALSESAIGGLSLVGDLYFTQPSGSCEDGGTYAEELELVVRVDGGDWQSRGLINSTSGWDMVEIPLGIPGGASSAKVGLRYSDCGGNWGYGVAVDNFSVMVPPELDLIGYNIYKNDEMMTFTLGEGFLDVVDLEGTYTYAVTTLLTMYGESAPVSADVQVTAPAPAMNPPRNLMVNTSGYSADLHWMPPAGSDQWLSYDNGMVGNALGGEDGFDFQVASRYPAQDLVEFQGKELQEIQFMGGSYISTSSYIMQVHTAQPGQAPELIYESEVLPGSELVDLDWNHHELENPIPMILGAEMWIGFRCISNGGSATYPAAVDNGPTHNGLGNLINGFGSEGFVSLQDVFGLAGNWMVRGYVAWPVPPPVELIMNHSFETTTSAVNWQGWEQHFATGWLHYPPDQVNHTVNTTGEMINPAGGGTIPFAAFEGNKSQKMWGQYVGENYTAHYQGFQPDSLGAPGTEITVEAHFYSHPDEPLAPGVSAYLYMTSFDAYWNLQVSQISELYNAESAMPDDWKHIVFNVTVPEDAATINIGVEFYQPDPGSGGSIWIDNLRAYRTPMAAVVSEVVPLEESKIAPRRTGGVYREQTAPKMMLAQNFPQVETREEFDFIGYMVYRDASALDSLDAGDHMYFDFVGEAATVVYHVTAAYENDAGVITEVSSNVVSVDLVNAAPTASMLVAPENESVITLTPQNVAGSDLQMFWSTSTDADGEQVEYLLSLQTNAGNIDTVLTGANLAIPYSDLYAFITDSAGLTQLHVSWNIHTTDGWDVTPSSNGPFTITIDAGWMLSTDEDLLPEVFALHNNYPNPFNPITNIRYDIPEVSDVRIDIYNLAGQRVRTLVSREHQPGRYRIKWNATNDFGSPVASGMYIYRIHAKDFVSVKKLLLMK